MFSVVKAIEPRDQLEAMLGEKSLSFRELNPLRLAPLPPRKHAKSGEASPKKEDRHWLWYRGGASVQIDFDIVDSDCIFTCNGRAIGTTIHEEQFVESKRV